MISGPRFLGVYLGGFAVAVAIGFYRRLAVLGPYRTAARQDYQNLSPESRAYVRGGASRVMELALFDLFNAGLVNADKDGRLVAAAVEDGPKRVGKDAPVSHQILRILQKEPKTFASLLRVSVPAIDSIRVDLAERRLVPDEATLKSARNRSLTPFWILGIIGIARCVQGISNDRPIGFLFMLLVATGITMIVFASLGYPGLSRADGLPVAGAGEIEGDRGSVIVGGLAAGAVLGAAAIFAKEALKGYPASSSDGSFWGNSSCGSSCGSGCGSGCGGGGGCGGCGGGGD